MHPATLGFVNAAVAAAATCIGGLGAMFVNADDHLVMAGSMALAAGIMVYISLADLMTEAKDSIAKDPVLGSYALLLSSVWFFTGILLVAVLDHFAHRWMKHNHDSDGSDQEQTDRDEMNVQAETSRDIDLERTDDVANRCKPSRWSTMLSRWKWHDNPKGFSRSQRDQTDLATASLVTVLAMGLHTLPEGISMFIATMHDPSAGVSIALAIAMHNIPQGLSVAMPVYFATGNRLRAFLTAVVIGMIDLVGAFIAWLLPTSLFSDVFFGAVFANVAGMMVFVSFVELLPLAHKKDPKNKVTVKALFVGMFIMAISLVILDLLK